MTLTFTQSSDQSFGGVPAYEAEFEVTGNFAIHIERTRGDAALILKQRTGGGKYALVDDFNYAKSKGEVLDYEASVSIPKFIKIVSEVEPTLAEIVTDGEVTEIKAQAKEIEVTTNGTTEVVPDSGFAYLSKVNIKTNVPQSGEGGGGTGGGSNIEYFAFDSSNIPIVVMATTSQLLKARTQSPDGTLSMIAAGPNMTVCAQLQTTEPETLAIGVDLNTKIAVKGPDGSSETQILLDTLLGSFTEEELAALPRITEEEFYNLNA